MVPGHVICSLMIVAIRKLQGRYIDLTGMESQVSTSGNCVVHICIEITAQKEVIFWNLSTEVFLPREMRLLVDLSLLNPNAQTFVPKQKKHQWNVNVQEFVPSGVLVSVRDWVGKDREEGVGVLTPVGCK